MSDEYHVTGSLPHAWSVSPNSVDARLSAAYLVESGRVYVWEGGRVLVDGCIGGWDVGVGGWVCASMCVCVCRGGGGGGAFCRPTWWCGLDGVNGWEENYVHAWVPQRDERKVKGAFAQPLHAYHATVHQTHDCLGVGHIQLFEKCNLNLWEAHVNAVVPLSFECAVQPPDVNHHICSLGGCDGGCEPRC
jgi:hypothetical protein